MRLQSRCQLGYSLLKAQPQLEDPFQGYWLIWLLVGCFTSYPSGLFCRLLGHPQDVAAGFLQSGWSRDSEKDRSQTIFCCCCSAAQLCPTLCNPMDCSLPDFLVLHHLPELAHTFVHLIGHAIHPSHPLLPPTPAFNLSQFQGLFQWVNSSH